MHAFDWKKRSVSQSSFQGGRRKLTQKEIYEELGSPVENYTKVYTERTCRCGGSHPDTKDQDTGGDEEEVRFEKNNQDTDPRP